MKRRRRNPQAQSSQCRDYHLRSLLRQALVQKLNLDFMPSRQYRSEQPKRWQSCSSSDSRESSAALSLDRYVKAFIGDKSTEEKEDRRNHTPLAPEDLDTRRGPRPSSPLHMSRIEGYWTSAFSTSDENADWTQHGYHNHHQLSTFQIRDQGGGWEHIRVLFDPSSRQSLVSEDTVHRLGMPLTPMPPVFSRPIHTRLGSVESRWFVEALMRTSADTSPVPVGLVSTKSLPAGLDVLIGEDLRDMPGGFTTLGSTSMSPGCSNWESSEIWLSTSSTIDDPVWLLEDGVQFTQEHLNHHHCSISQPESDKGSSWDNLCGPTIGLSNNLVQYLRKEPPGEVASEAF